MAGAVVAWLLDGANSTGALVLVLVACGYMFISDARAEAERAKKRATEMADNIYFRLTQIEERMDADRRGK
jgi:hypothetical protein